MIDLSKILSDPKKEFWFYRGLSLFAVGVFVTVLLIESFFLSQTGPEKVIGGTGSKTLTTQADWEEGTTTGYVSTTQLPGDLVLEKQISSSAYWTANPYSPSYLTPNPFIANIDSSAVVSDRTNIYVIGGENYPVALNRLDRYNIASDDWTALATLPEGISRTAAGYNNGKIYVFGGMDSGFSSFNTNSYVYDISSNSWSEIAGLSYGRENGTAVVVDGNIYFYGGWCDEASEPNCRNHINVYSISGNSWSTIITSIALVQSCSGGQIGSDFYCVGGQPGPSAVSNLAYKFNWETNDWDAIDTLNHARTLPLVVGLLGKLYVFGGGDEDFFGVAPSEVYDPNTNTFSDLGAGGNIARGGINVNNAVVDDRVYCYGGPEATSPPGTNNYINRYPKDQEYFSPGTHTSVATQIDAGTNISSWDELNSSETKPENTTISYRARSSDNGSNWTSWYGPWQASSPINISSVPAKRYLQIESTLSTTDNTTTPILHDYTITWTTGTSPPPGNANENENKNANLNENANENRNENANENENKNRNQNYNYNFNRNDNGNIPSPPPGWNDTIRIITEVIVGPLIAISTIVALWPWLLSVLAASPVLDRLLSYLYFYFNRFLEFIGLRKRRKRFGIVYDAGTKRPLPFAMLRIFDAKEERLKERSVSDKNGAFGFLVPSGEYLIKVFKSGYHFPSEKVLPGELRRIEEGKTKFIPGRVDGIFENVYLGEVIEIEKKTGGGKKGTVSYQLRGAASKQPLEISIPLDRTNEITFSYLALSLLKKISRVLKLLELPLLILGTTAALFLFFSRRSLVDLLIVLLYLFVWTMEVASYFKNKSYGEVLDAKTGRTLDLVLLKLREKETNKIAAVYVTGRDGRFIFKSPPGRYYVEATREDYIPLRTKIFKLKSSYDIKGMKIKMKRR